ncbi:aminoglycoside phosphotransferase family protein [Bacteroidia bacterium]|nr:aminoglycoside phosphotransferase family protein [Bacteroidia bacterium]
MGRLSLVIWQIQKVLYSPILFWSNPKECQNFLLIKSGKKFYGSVNTVMSYILLKDPLRVNKKENMLLSEIYLGAGFKASSPAVIEQDEKIGVNKVQFIKGVKKLITSDFVVLFPVLKELYSQGQLISYRDRVENLQVADILVPEGVSHGDFAPFNMIFAENNVVLIDWNDSFLRGPILYDLFYYIISSIVLFRADNLKSKILDIVKSYLSYIGLKFTEEHIKIEMIEILRLWRKKGVNMGMVIYLEEISEKNSYCS